MVQWFIWKSCRVNMDIEAETDRKEGWVYSMEEFRSMMDELIIRHQNSQT